MPEAEVMAIKDLRPPRRRSRDGLPSGGDSRRHTTLARRSAPISSAVIPASASTSSIYSPSAGADVRRVPGVAPKAIGVARVLEVADAVQERDIHALPLARALSLQERRDATRGYTTSPGPYGPSNCCSRGENPARVFSDGGR